MNYELLDRVLNYEIYLNFKTFDIRLLHNQTISNALSTTS